MVIPFNQRIGALHFLFLSFTCSHSESDWEPDNLASSSIKSKIDNQLQNIAELQAVDKPGRAHWSFFSGPFRAHTPFAVDKDPLSPS